MTDTVADFPEILDFLFEFGRYRFKVPYGGRNGMKSWAIARALLIIAAREKKRVLCTREFQNSIKQSVHKLLKDQIPLLGLSDRYRVTDQAIIGSNGSEFIFAGLRHNLDSIKSIEGIDIAWVEEAQTISQQSMDVLHPTVRKEGSEIWYSFNPRLATDPVFKFFVGDDDAPTPPENACVRMVSYADNPWLSQVIKEEIAALFKSDPDKAAWVYGGRTVQITDAQVLRGRWHVEEFTPKPGWSGPHYGLDFGFAVSPTAAVELYIDGDTLYVHNEVSGTNIDTVDLPSRLKEIPLLVQNVCRADCSRPETISHLRRHGYPRVIGCFKGKNSIEGGLEHLRSYKRIVIHPRCELAIEQALLYSFKRDPQTDEVKKPAVPEDKNDDIWDAVRYALEPIILRGKPKAPPPPPAPEPMDYRAKRAIQLRQRRG